MNPEARLEPRSNQSAAAQAARETCAVRWLDGCGTLAVSGPDRAAWLNGLVTCDVRRVEPGQASWGLALNRTGKIQSLLWIVAQGEALLVGTAAGTAPSLLLEFERMLVMEDAELRDVSAEQAWAYVVGPASTSQQWASSVGGAGAGIATAALDLLGLGGVIAVGPRQLLQAALAGTVELDDEAWLRLRLERGLVQWGQEFDATDRPHEAGLERRAVDWKKGCYLGQEVVCMQDMRGKVSRRLERVLVEGNADPQLRPTGQAIQLAGEPKPLGTIKTASYSERAGGWLAFAMLPVPVPESGMQLAGAVGVRNVTRVDVEY